MRRRGYPQNAGVPVVLVCTKLIHALDANIYFNCKYMIWSESNLLKDTPALKNRYGVSLKL